MNQKKVNTVEVEKSAYAISYIQERWLMSHGGRTIDHLEEDHEGNLYIIMGTANREGENVMLPNDREAREYFTSNA